jgi:protein Tob/BTG
MSLTIYNLIFDFSFFCQILYSEQKHDSPDDNNADREVTTTFNPEAQCFRPIEILSSSLNGLTLSPKGSPNDSSPTSSTSPMYKNTSPSGNNGAGAAATTTTTTNATFLSRQQEPVLFTTATFAQTKFGSTKLKNNSKRTNRYVYLFIFLKHFWGLAMCHVLFFFFVLHN